MSYTALKIENVIYMTHNEKQIPAVRILDDFGPPNSPPIIILLAVRIVKQTTEVIKNSITENPSVPAGTIEACLHKIEAG